MSKALDTSLFDNLTRRERAIALRFGTMITLPRGRLITRQGDFGRQFAVVASGELSVQRDGVEIAVLRAGDCVGEIALMAGPRARHTATVEVIGTAEVLVLSPPEFDELCAVVPRVATRIGRIGVRRLAESTV